MTEYPRFVGYYSDTRYERIFVEGPTSVFVIIQGENSNVVFVRSIRDYLDELHLENINPELRWNDAPMVGFEESKDAQKFRTAYKQI